MTLIWLVIVGAGVGGITGAWIQKQLRRRRLRKLGFLDSDLKSKNAFFEKMAEIVSAKAPGRISFRELGSHSWSDLSRYASLREEFESLGFTRVSLDAVDAMKLVGEFWAKPDSNFLAGIFDSTIGGVHSEVMVAYNDGSTVTFENTLDCGFRHSEINSWIHCGTVPTAELIGMATKDQQQKPLTVIPCSDGVRAYERAVNGSLSWRRKVGYNAEEMRRMQERVKKLKKKK